MKKNPALRLGAIVLVLSVISVSLATGTFAKYTKGISNTPETIAAAKFDFDIKKGAAGDAYTTGDTFGIFEYTDAGVWADGEGNAAYIAPGTTGALPLYVENLSQVDLQLAFQLNETNDKDIPIYYTLETVGTPDPTPTRYSDALQGIEYATGVTYQPLSALATVLQDGGTLEATDGTATTAYTKDYILHWAWAFETTDTEYDTEHLLSNDDYDTKIGLDADGSVMLGITATVTQVD